MGRRCVICRNINKPFFEIPSDIKTRVKWIKVLKDFCDPSKFTDYILVCKNHFKAEDFNTTGKSCRLIKGAVPSVDNPLPREAADLLAISIERTSSKSTQVNKISVDKLTRLRNSNKYFRLKCKESHKRHLECEAKIKDLEEEISQNSNNLTLINKISRNVEEGDETAIFLMDLIKDYYKNTP